jgi:transcriptional regulator with XRE-family HTH domain
MNSLSLEDAILSSLGPALRYLREQRGLTQVELAERAGIGRSLLSLYEHNKSTPSFQNLRKILYTLGCDFHDLHNALKISEGKFDEVCTGQAQEKQEKETASEKVIEWLKLLVKLASRGAIE